MYGDLATAGTDMRTSFALGHSEACVRVSRRILLRERRGPLRTVIAIDDLRIPILQARSGARVVGSFARRTRFVFRAPRPPTEVLRFLRIVGSPGSSTAVPAVHEDPSRREVACSG